MGETGRMIEPQPELPDSFPVMEDGTCNPFQPDGSDEDEELRTLSRSLAYAEGFKLFFIGCNQPHYAKKLMDRMQEQNSQLRLHNMQLPAAVPHLLDALVGEIGDRTIDVLVVYGIEFSLPRAEIAEKSPFVANLNAARNSFPLVITCPLILVLPEFALRAIMRGAPDFFSVRSGVYFFQQHKFGENQARDLSLRDDLLSTNIFSMEERQERILQLEERLREFYALESTARDRRIEYRLLNRLGELYLQGYQWEKAENYFQQRLSLARNDNDPADEAEALRHISLVYYGQRQWRKAEECLMQSLSINKNYGDEFSESRIYHLLGMVSQQQRNFDAAHNWYRHALAITEKLRDEQVAARTYYQLGRLSEEQYDFAAAERCYRKSLDIEEKLGDEHGAALTYHQLGNIAEMQHDFASAESWYYKSLAIMERMGDDLGTARTYHQLGCIAQEKREYTAAESWYRQALAINEKQGNYYGMALTYGQLGNLSIVREHYTEACRWLSKSIVTFWQCNDQHFANIGIRNFFRAYKCVSNYEQSTLKDIWTEAELGPFPTEEEIGGLIA